VSERPVDRGISAVDGEIRTIAQVGGKVIFGGTFTKVGPAPHGAAGSVDLGGAAFRSGFPAVAGAVFAAVPDGAGGWYLGGSFTAVGGVARRNAAHVDAGGGVGPWNPDPDGAVYALAVESDAVYLGGGFVNVDGQPASRLAKVDRSAGDIVWAGAPNNVVRALALAPAGGRLYVGGQFTKVGATTVLRLAALSTGTGSLDTTFGLPSVNNVVRTIEASTDSVWFGGEFTTVNGSSRIRLAALDAATGGLKSFRADANGVVFDIQAGPDGLLYAGGRFSTVGGQTRNRVAAVDAVTGSVSSLTVTGITGDVLAVAPDGTTGLHIAGTFVITPEKTQPARLARIDLATGAATAVVSYAALPQSLSRAPVTGGTGIYVLARNGADLFIAGDFSDYGLVDRARLGAYALATGALDTGFAPAPDGPVNIVKGSADGQSVFVGGQFTTMAGQPHRNIAKLDLTTGVPAASFTASTDSYVKDMAVRSDGQAVYVGGNFDNVNGSDTTKLAALDPTSGALLSGFVMPLTEPTGPTTEGGARALALSPDDRTLMVIGNFRRVNNVDRPLVAQIDVSQSQATVTEWRTELYNQPCARGQVGWMRDVDFAPDGATAYIVSAGHFYYPACDSANAFPMGVTGNDVKPLWTTKIGDTIESVAATGGVVYIGGHFRYIETETLTQSRFQLAALDPDTGVGLNWVPNADGFRGVVALESEPAGLLIGSDGDTVGGVPHGRMALFASPDPGIDVRKLPDVPWVLTPGGPVRFTVTVRNTYSDRPVTLTTLSDERLGNLGGKGTCTVPQMISAGGSYACEVDDTATGAALTEIKSTTTATATEGTTSLTDADRSVIQVLSSAPVFRLRVGAAPPSVQFPQGDVLFGLTVMNLDLKRSATLTSLVSPQHGDLSSACGLPVVIGPNKLHTCHITRPVGGPVGSRPASSFTAQATYDTGSLSSTASGSTTMLAPPDGSKLLLVVGDAAALSSADTSLKSRLATNYNVQAIDDDVAVAGDAADAAFVLIAPSVGDTKVGTKFTNVAVPVLVIRPTLLDEFKLTGATAADQGSVSGTSYDVVKYLHPLARAFSGAVSVVTADRPLNWGRPGPEADLVARLGPDQSTLFSYGTGKALIDSTPSPACRVALPAGASTLTRWSTNGWALFDRAAAYSAAACGRGMLSTVAGNGNTTYPGDGRPATAVGFNSPWGLAVDAAGNIYVADTSNNAVRKIDANGIVTTVAGTGTAGLSGDGGPATVARLNGPARIAFSPSGDLFIADTNNNRVRRVNASGVITTVAGTGSASYGGDGGQATAARIRQPYDIAFGPDGAYYIADRGNQRVRKVATTGIITTVAGNGVSGYNGDDIPATSARLRTPYSLAVDSHGNLFIADYDNERVRKVNSDGIISTVAGTGVATASGDGGLAIEAGLHKPSHVLVTAAGDLFISEQNNNRVRRVDPTGMIETFAGTGQFGYTGDGGPPVFSTWNRPSAAAFDSAGNLYILDRSNRRVRIIAAS
jgi:hypothetical protein